MVQVQPGPLFITGLKKLQSLGRAFGSGPNAWACEVKIGSAEVVEMKALLDNVAKVDRRCHKNVVARLDFRTAASLLVVRVMSPRRFAPTFRIAGAVQIIPNFREVSISTV